MEAFSAPPAAAPAAPVVGAARLAVTARTAALGAVVLLAAGLRLASFGDVQPNPFYDAAVRSMSQSWHNFFFGAFEPGGSVSIDKAPLDLWLQVLSVKLFGFGSVALRLPEALAGTAAVVLLYDVVRRLCGRTAGLAAAAGLAVLPVAVLTSRSDTMDSVLLALILAAAWLVVRAAERDRIAPLLGAGAVLGIAFNVKLFEALVPVPALVVLYLVAADAPVRTRLLRLTASGAVFVALALSWVTAASLAPGAKPFPIGSTNGSVWNVIFKYNGIDRLGGGTQPKTAAPVAHPTTAKARARAERKRVHAQHAAAAGPRPGRLFARGASQNGGLIGAQLIVAFMFGALALGAAATRWRPRAVAAIPADRRRRAAVAAFGVWAVTGTVLFTAMSRLHSRYLEAMTASVAAVAGIAIASLALRAPRSRVAALALGGGVVAGSALAIRLSGATGTAATVSVTAAIAAAVGCAALVVVPERWAASARGGAGQALVVASLVAVLAAPTATSLAIVRSGAQDSGRPGVIPPHQLSLLAGYLAPRTNGTKYEIAAYAAARAGSLIVRDGRPVMVLTSYNGLPLVSSTAVAHAVRTGQVKYALLPRGRCTPQFGSSGRCAPGVRWARAHSVDVSRQAGLRKGTLFHLTTQRHKAA